MQKGDTRMFKVVKVLYSKYQRVKFVHDKQERYVSQPQEIHKIIEKHFKNHYKKDNTNIGENLITPPKRLNKMTTAKKMTKAVQKMANKKAPRKNNINIELIKYAPEEVHQEINKILYRIFNNNNEEVKLGAGVLLLLPEPKKTQ